MTPADARRWQSFRSALVSYAQSAAEISPEIAQLFMDNYSWHHRVVGHRFLLLGPARGRRPAEERFFETSREAHLAYATAIRARGRVALDSHTFELFAINPDGTLRTLARSWGERRNAPARKLPLFV